MEAWRKSPKIAAPGKQTSPFAGFGMYAVVRLLIYLAIGFAGLILLSAAVKKIFHPAPGHHHNPLGIVQSHLIVLACSLGAAAIMAKLEKRPFGAYGLPSREIFGKYFWQGVAWGFAWITALMLLIAAAHGYSFGRIVLGPGELLRYALAWAAVYLVVGFNEEFLFRGYVQYTLGGLVGFWPSAIVISAAFGATHLRNPGEGWVGAATVVTVGLFFCLTLWRTGSLWFAVGLHAAFDFGETFLYSVPNSGIVGEGHLSNALLHGPAWLTGGTVGPEGSVFCFLTMALLFILFARLYPAKSNPMPAHQTLSPAKESSSRNPRL